MRSCGVGALALVVLLGGCAQESGDGAVPRATEEVPHGYVEGAEEMPEPQSRLVLADGGTGTVHVLDLLTEQTTAVARVEDVRGVTGDGRFAYVTAGAGGLHVIDSGAWAVDHGDHFHYYRTAARDLGAVAERPSYAAADTATITDTAATADTATTAVRTGDGTITLLDRARMEQGELVEAGEIENAAAVLPYRGHLLVAEGGAVRVEGGAGVGACVDAAGTAVTRRGVIFGCADGALLVTEKDGAFEGVKIRYPHKTPASDRATAFRHRPGSSTMAAKAGDSGTWVLDVAARTWKLLRTGPVVAVTAVGEDAPVLTLTEDGVLRAHDPASGKEIAGTKLLAEPLTGSPDIQVDTGRAYVNDPAGKAVYEIDYNDDLRRARTFRPGFAPTYMTETGR
ncbi:ABC transporter [Nonomuraea sp. NPDC047897]|uniref:ABC transporter n=1 Tax=Nonomuraea sp. NPDC047897 TaxID=3364346 RepID=UPI003723EC4D